MRDTVQDKTSWAEHGIHVEPRFVRTLSGRRCCGCCLQHICWCSGVLPFPGTSLPFRIEFPHRIRKHDDEHDDSRRSCSPMLAGRIGYLRWNERSVSPLGEQGD
ncbi:hypothetical protein E4U60_004128 [Claviceps pazoutovae]|uniref:Uncharacterized protein n=1 Tax=Claviceps pazoutovae TaxID=1649127 RepID=A0A9P7M9M3_9HYPO|nr:hypothetical protein E4U60_004128 [Claviceps pazoutovae]